MTVKVTPRVEIILFNGKVSFAFEMFYGRVTGECERMRKTVQHMVRVTRMVVANERSLSKMNRQADR